MPKGTYNLPKNVKQKTPAKRTPNAMGKKKKK